MHIVYVALGANLMDRAERITSAIAALADVGTVDAVSTFIETDPVGYTAQPKFLNAAIRLLTQLEPQELLTACGDIERRMGRVRSVQNGPRTIDIDLLLYDNMVIDSEDLTLPHPRMHERAFVLAPLSEIAPDVVHPLLHASIRKLHDGLREPELAH